MVDLKKMSEEALMADLKQAAMVALRDCMAVSDGESVLILTDVHKRRIGAAMWECAKELGAEAMILEMIPRESNGEEPPHAIAEIMKQVDVLLCPTTKSVSHTDARRAASKKGVRIATLPGITEDMMIRTLNADYHRIAEVTIKLAEILTRAKTAHVTSPTGTDIILPIDGRAADPDTGLVHNKGDFSNLPAGEAYLAPVEDKSHGVIVIDGAMAGLGMLQDSHIRIKVEKGYAVEITGGKEAEELNKLVDQFGKPARNIAELGIGTNFKARITGNVLEDEKAVGTVHIALGDNISMGGNVKVPSHLDGIIKNPTVEVDGKVIMKNGELTI
ncbi:aminopeptidase [candidate division KSB1 bacterium]